ncbi:MAG: FG-GAP repeat domain-containing protein [Bryobacteraceae bacterium]
MVDWNGDGRLDLLASLPRPTQHHVLFRNTGGPGVPFAPPETIDLPLIPVIGSVVRVLLADANRDGDRDFLMLSGDGDDCLFEGSFLARGYAKGDYVRLERRTP